MNKEDRIIFGKYIRGIRHREGLTQVQLGELIGKTKEQIGCIENGKCFTDNRTKGLLSKALNTDISILKSFNTVRE
jgi:transcriptional regulator with XRE-family HTH domain